MKGSVLKRMWILYAGIIVIAGILLTKLFYVQIVYGEMYAEKADRQYVAPRSQSFDRGSIYFSEKDGTHVPAASLKAGYTLAISPKQLIEPSMAYEALSDHIDIDKEIFLQRAGKQDDPYEEIARRIDQTTADAIQELEIDGVLIIKEKWRSYPSDSLASQVLGFVGYKGNRLDGRYGLERYYDDILRRDDEKLYVNFFAEVFSNISDSFTDFDKSNREGDIVTTIEPWVQTNLEQQLEKVQEKWEIDRICLSINIQSKLNTLQGIFLICNLHMSRSNC